ncbi:uncharacterized protein ARMOST_14918 [Armillaria ostoyae]|uniref:F-box domain-containing protein n=1 Tax=Armillaria ostoyae TaxID=47428 RepID=A0A284RRX4_ARMOS|nr:uncharacterized protein ARMOST_14918 [Armillaria ostoyae]
MAVFASQPSLSALFVGAVSDYLWSDVEGIVVDNNASGPQATHLIIQGEVENEVNELPVQDFVEQLTALHTAQFYFVTAGSAQTLAWKMPSLRRLFLWNSSVSPEGLQVLMGLLPNLIHFAVGGKHTKRITEDHFGDSILQDPDDDAIKTLPRHLTYLHIDITALVGENSSETDAGVRPQVIHWLSSLESHIPVTTLELKLFSNDVRIGRNLLSLCASTVETVRLYFIDSFVGSAFVDLSEMLRLRHFYILTSEVHLHELLNVVWTIRLTDFEDVNICVALTSFDHTFAGLKLWDDAYVGQELGIIRVVNLSCLMRELEPRSVISWFEDGGFLARFADTTDCHCVCDE